MHKISYKKLSIITTMLIALGFVWGSGYVLARYAVTHGVQPLGYAFWQSLGPALLVWLIIKIRKGHLPLRGEHWRFYLVCGILGIALPNTLMYFVAVHVQAGMLAVIVNTVPLMVYPIAILASQERLSLPRIMGVLIGMAGIILILSPKILMPNQQLTAWILLALLSPLSFAVCSVYLAANRPANSDSFALTVGMLGMSSLMLIPWVIYHHAFYSLLPPFNNVDGVIVLEIILSSIGYILFFELIRLAGPVFYSLVGGVVTLTGLFWGRVILGEVIHAWMMLAALLIVTGIVIVACWQPRRDG